MRTSRNRTSIAIAAIATAAVTASIAEEASASTLTRIMSAASCIGEAGTVPKVSSKGNVYNDSTTDTMKVICPIDPDVWYYDRIELIHVIATDYTKLGDVTCRISTTSDIGTVQANGPSGFTSGHINGPVIVGLVMPTGTRTGTWYVRCTLPKRGAGEKSSQLNSIFVVQLMPD